MYDLSMTESFELNHYRSNIAFVSWHLLSLELGISLSTMTLGRNITYLIGNYSEYRNLYDVTNVTRVITLVQLVGSIDYVLDIERKSSNIVQITPQLIIRDLKRKTHCMECVWFVVFSQNHWKIHRLRKWNEFYGREMISLY